MRNLFGCLPLSPPVLYCAMSTLLNFPVAVARFEDNMNKLFAKTGQFPFVAFIDVPIVSLPYNILPQKQCTGAIHSGKVVLTSCRCVALEISSWEMAIPPRLLGPEGTRVIVGTIDYNRGGQRRHAVKFAAHSECRTLERLVVNDFSFIYVDREFNFNRNVKPIAVVSEELSVFESHFKRLVARNTRCQIISWGCACKSFIVKSLKKSDDSVHHLEYSPITLVDSDKCSSALERLKMLFQLPLIPDVLPEEKKGMQITCGLEIDDDQSPYLTGFTGAPLVCGSHYYGTVSSVIIPRTKTPSVILFTSFGATLGEFELTESQ